MALGRCNPDLGLQHVRASYLGNAISSFALAFVVSSVSLTEVSTKVRIITIHVYEYLLLRSRRSQSSACSRSGFSLSVSGCTQKNKTAFESAVTGETRARVQFATGYCGEGDAGVNGENSCTDPEHVSSKVKGFGLFGLVGEETDSQRNHDVGGDCANVLRERAEVWFDRIDSQK